LDGACPERGSCSSGCSAGSIRFSPCAYRGELHTAGACSRTIFRSSVRPTGMYVCASAAARPRALFSLRLGGRGRTCWTGAGGIVKSGCARARLAAASASSIGSAWCLPLAGGDLWVSWTGGVDVAMAGLARAPELSVCHLSRHNTLSMLLFL
jgi:hypothetical protein